MRTSSSLVRVGIAFLVALVLTACGGTDSPPPPPSEGQATIGAAGGVVQGPDGVQVAIGEGVLAQDTTVRIAGDSTGAPDVGGLRLLSRIYQLTPHGLQFDAPARISIPFDPAALRSGTAPVIVRAQAGGTAWELLASDVVGGNVVAADSDGFSYYAVGECFVSSHISVPGPDPIAACPSSQHALQLTLRDGSGAMLPQPRSASGALLPAITIDQPTTIGVNVSWRRPAGTSRTDTLLTGTTANLVPALRRNVSVTSDSLSLSIIDVPIDPATISGASAPGGRLLTIWASVSYTFDAWYPGCPCWGPASWIYSTRLLIRVVHHGVQPAITQQPGNVSVTAGQTASFAVAATGPGLSYQWRRSNDGGQRFVDVAGATQSSFSLAAALADDGAQFRARVCSRSGSPAVSTCLDSQAATLTVVPAAVAPAFTQQPQSMAVVAGQTASLSVVAAATPAPTVRWFQVRASPMPALEVGAPCTGSGNQTICSYTTPALSVAQSGIQYFAEASNSAGTVVSTTATITVQASATAPAIPPSEPADVSAVVGQSATFAVNATGTAPLSYQWRRDGADIAGANGAGYTLANARLADGGARFSVVVSNGAGSATSREATLTVTLPPSTGGACTGSSATGWCFAQPTPHASDMMAIALDGSQLYAFGGGVRMRSGDQGATWSTDFPSDLAPRDVQVPAAGVLLAAADRPGAHGVFRSIDGGQTWSQVLDATTLAVNSLAFSGANGVAVGSAIWRTSDGGSTWSFVDFVPDNGFLRRVAAVGGDVFVAVGSAGRIMRSTDAGLTWVNASSGLSGDIVDAAFGSATTGVAIDAGGMYTRTTDGGVTWTAEALAGGYAGAPATIAFSGPADVVVVTNEGWVLRSADGGSTWATPFAGWDTRGSNWSLRLRFVNASEGIAVGAYGTVVRTTDGGQSWTRLGGGGTMDRLDALRFSPAGIGLAGGFGNVIWRSVDGGQVWTPHVIVEPGHPAGDYRYVGDLAFAGTAAVAAAGQGRLYRSADGGLTWARVLLDPGVTFFGVDFASPSVGVAVGSDGANNVIRRSGDGGQTWSVVSLPPQPGGLFAVRFASSTLGYAAGALLLRTADAGQTWAPVSVTSLYFNERIQDIAAPASGVVVLASSSGIHRSTDGGSTWTRVASGRFEGLSFANATTGVAVGDGVVRTTDGGATWSAVGRGLPTMDAVTHASANTVIAVGFGGAIVRNEQGGAAP